MGENLLPICVIVKRYSEIRHVVAINRKCARDIRSLPRLTGKPGSNLQSAASNRSQPEPSQCCHGTLGVPSHARRRARPIVIASFQTNPAQCAAKKMGRSHELNSFLRDIDIV